MLMRANRFALLSNAMPWSFCCCHGARHRYRPMKQRSSMSEASFDDIRKPFWLQVVPGRDVGVICLIRANIETFGPILRGGDGI